MDVTKQSTNEGDLRPDERRDRVADLVLEHGRLTVDELARRLDVSRETIRRDLGLLADRGVVRKYHGGAAAIGSAQEGPFQARLYEQAREKRAIARAASRLFHPGDTLFIDTGTTTLTFAEELAKIGGLTVITNSASIAAALARAEVGNDVYLLGGAYNEDASETLGPLATEQIRRFHAVHAVLTIGALDEAGRVMDYNLEEAEVARAMLLQARTITIVADSSKLGRSALFEVCHADEIDRLVTDRLPEPMAGMLRNANVEVVIAETA